MLRLALAAALFAPATFAQGSAPGVVVGLGTVSYGSSALDGVRGARELSVGHQRADGVWYGLRGAVALRPDANAFRVGPTVGLTLAPAGALRLYAAGAAAVERQTVPQSDGDAFFDDRTAVSMTADAAVGLDLGIAGSVRVAPRAGAFVTATTALAQDLSGVRPTLLDRLPHRYDASARFAGVSAALPVSFRVLGRTAELAVRAEVIRTGPIVAPDMTSSLRVTF